MERWRKLAFTGLLAGTLALAACGGEPADEEENGNGEDAEELELNIGTILPLTGDLGSLGPPIENGARLAVQQLNECGGLQVNGVYEDSGTNEQTSSSAADKLINTDNASVVVGAGASRNSFAIVDSLAQSGVVQISPASTSPDFTDYEDNGYFFRTVPSDALQGIVLSEIAEDEGYETVNVLALNDDYGQGIAEVFEENFTEAGGTVDENIAYDPMGTSFQSEVEQVSSGEPDAVMVASFPDTGSIIMQQASEQGLVGEVPFLFTDGLADPELPESSGVDLEGEMGTRPATEGPGTEDFTEAYQEEFDSSPGTFSSNAYDAVMLAALAASAAGDTDGEAIRDSLPDVSQGGEELLPGDICEGLEAAANGDDVNYQGAAGAQDFDDNGDVTSDYELWEFDEEGEIGQVELIEAPETPAE